jgi:hypothetical protein
MSTSRWPTWTPKTPIIQKSAQPEPPKPPKLGFEGFAGSPPGIFQKIGADSTTKPFPHCPKCASYALYRQNNIGNYECMTCGLLDIPEDVARRVTIQ